MLTKRTRAENFELEKVNKKKIVKEEIQLEPTIANSRNLKLLQKRQTVKNSDCFDDLQPYIEVNYQSIIKEIYAESYIDPLWRIWLKAAKSYSNEGSTGKEITEVLHLGSHVIGVTHLGICFSFDQCKYNLSLMNYLDSR